MAYVTVDVEIEDFSDRDLIDELRYRGYHVDDEGGPSTEKIKDDIFNLYKEWISDQGDRDNRFEKAMREFFKNHLNKASV